ncbi:hypothetical protein [Amycolatopsis thailandensis]|uniref:hypothetical protein n=1 Tax=Amycolatopsis thailandensis TaxID=589330 RepID=UPI0026B0373E
MLFNTGEWDISLAPVTLLLPSQVSSFVSGPKPPAGTNFAHIENEKYTSEAAKAAQLPGDSGCATWLAAESALIERLDVVPYVNSVVPIFGSNARFKVNFGTIEPSSVRMYS